MQEKKAKNTKKTSKGHKIKNKSKKTFFISPRCTMLDPDITVSHFTAFQQTSHSAKQLGELALHRKTLSSCDANNELY